MWEGTEWAAHGEWQGVANGECAEPHVRVRRVRTVRPPPRKSTYVIAPERAPRLVCIKHHRVPQGRIKCANKVRLLRIHRCSPQRAQVDVDAKTTL